MCASCNIDQTPTYKPENNKKLKPEVKAEWLDALRSGDFKQGKGKLRKILPSLFQKGKKDKRAERFCCYGVLCDIYQNATDNSKWEMDSLDGEFRFYDAAWSNSYAMPTDRVFAWAGVTGDGIYLDESDGKKLKKDGDPRSFVSLAELNDEGKSFKTIADLIEKYL